MRLELKEKVKNENQVDKKCLLERMFVFEVLKRGWLAR